MNLIRGTPLGGLVVACLLLAPRGAMGAGVALLVDGTCPTAEALEAALGRRGIEVSSGAGWRLSLAAGRAAIRSPRGELSLLREIPSQDCPALAEAVVGPITVTGSPAGTYILEQDQSPGVVRSWPAMTLDEFPYGTTLTASGKGKNLAQGPFKATVKVPLMRRITSPSHEAPHDVTQPLRVTWSGATYKGEVWLTLKHNFFCRVKDDGEFLIPASAFNEILKWYAAGTMPLEVCKINEANVPVKGLPRGFTFLAGVHDEIEISAQ
jgi:hypothetical protein